MKWGILETTRQYTINQFDTILWHYFQNHLIVHPFKLNIHQQTKCMILNKKQSSTRTHNTSWSYNLAHANSMLVCHQFYAEHNLAVSIRSLSMWNFWTYLLRESWQIDHCKAANPWSSLCKDMINLIYSSNFFPLVSLLEYRLLHLKVQKIEKKIASSAGPHFHLHQAFI